MKNKITEMTQRFDVSFQRSFNVNSVVGRQGLVAGAEVAYNAKEARVCIYKCS